MLRIPDTYPDKSMPLIVLWRFVRYFPGWIRSDNVVIGPVLAFAWWLTGRTDAAAKKTWRKRLVDVLILGFLGFCGLSLALWPNLPAWAKWVAKWLVILRLAEIANVLLIGDLTPNRRSKDTGKLRKFVSSRWRYMLHTIFTVAQVVLGFAVLYLVYGPQFDYHIEDAWTAIYVSLLTITTLGYGEIHPVETCWIAKAIVMGELTLFVILLVVRIPLAIGLSYVVPSDEKKAEEWLEL